MRIMEHLLTSYFVIKGVNSQESPIKKVKVYSAKFKLGSSTFKGKQNYSARKKLAVTRCAEYLKETTQTDEMNTKFEKSKKKDDLADTVMQAISFTKRIEPIQSVSKKSKKLVPRKPNENQKQTRYSKSNLAYIYKNKTELEVLENNKRFMKDLKRYYKSIDDLVKELA